MVQTLKKMLTDQMEAFTADTGMDQDETSDQLDMLEQGLASLYNPSLLEASQRVSTRQGLVENIIRREKSTMTYVMYEQVVRPRVNSGLKVAPKTPKAILENSVEVMRARYKPAQKEFWIFNGRVPIEMLDDCGNAFAKLYWSPEKNQFVLKNRHCTHCTQRSHYFCDEKASRAWPFQQELGYFKIVSVK